MKILKWILGAIAVLSIILAFITIKWGYDAYIQKENVPKHTLDQMLNNDTLDNMADLGQYYSGTTVMLLTLSTVLFVILAFMNQREEINLQKGIIEQNKKEAEFNKFENTFYRLLDWHKTYLNSLQTSSETKSTGKPTIVKYYNGRLAILQMLQHFENLYEENKDKEINIAIFQTYKRFELDFHEMIGTYWNNLISLLDLINDKLKEKIIDEKDELQYANILKGQLSSYELNLLFYYALSGESKIKLKEYIERYTLLKYLKKETLIKEAVELYKDSAFNEY